MKITSSKAAEQALNRLLTVEAAQQKVVAKANEKIAEIRDAHLEQIAEYDKEALALRNAVQVFADSSRENEEIFIPGKKSLALNAGTFGFRDNPEQIVLRKGYDTEDVIENAKAEGLKKLVKPGKETLDKTAAKGCDDSTLKKIGLQREQSETFFIELNTVKEV